MFHIGPLEAELVAIVRAGGYWVLSVVTAYNESEEEMNKTLQSMYAMSQVTFPRSARFVRGTVQSLIVVSA